MDAITHVMAPMLVTEPASFDLTTKARYAQWRERLAVVAAALLPDVDGILGLIRQEWYANYHRVVSHSVFVVIAIALIAALIARYWPAWLLFPSMKKSNPDGDWINPPYRRLLGFASIALASHLLLDGITAWGTLPILWPMLPDWHFQLYWVNSLELPITLLTLSALAVQHVFIQRRQRRPAWLTVLVWLELLAVYIIIRQYVGLIYT
jgi:membrane-bound metal-dependent hydrolase YbcI (DUF457 family)